MDLDTQIQTLINDAPQDGITPSIVAAIAPGLKLLAHKLRHLQYFILQSLEHDWVVTTLSNRDDPELEKQVIYAFPTLQDVAAGYGTQIDPQAIALSIPVMHILFQLTALEGVDSLVFFESPGDLSQGIEIRREDIQHLIQIQLQKSSPDTSRFSPPDIA